MSKATQLSECDDFEYFLNQVEDYITTNHLQGNVESSEYVQSLQFENSIQDIISSFMKTRVSLCKRILYQCISKDVGGMSDIQISTEKRIKLLKSAPMSRMRFFQTMVLRYVLKELYTLGDTKSFGASGTVTVENADWQLQNTNIASVPLNKQTAEIDEIKKAIKSKELTEKTGFVGSIDSAVYESLQEEGKKKEKRRNRRKKNKESLRAEDDSEGEYERVKSRMMGLSLSRHRANVKLSDGFMQTMEKEKEMEGNDEHRVGEGSDSKEEDG